MLSVPYALYAKESGSGGGGGDPTDELQNLIYDPATQILTLTDGNSVTLQVGGGGGMPQSLSFDNATRILTISDGNAIEIPGGAVGPQGEAGPEGPAGPAGTDGQDGTGISLLGTVATVGDLPAMGNTQGDLYIVTASGDGYAWDGAMWNNAGPIQGPAGPAGADGAVGPQGDAGPAGMDGAPGSQGPQGSAGPQGDAGPAGMDGQDGTGISLLGTMATVGDLPTMGNTQGDLYIVTASGDGYAWDGSMWNNAGPIQGPAGPAGADGAVGPQGDAGPAGMDGAPGSQGPQGSAGPQGDAGPAGMDGQDGTGISLLGTVATVGDLPTMGNTQGDLYIITASGDGYAWDGSMWNNAGPIQGPAGPAGADGAVGQQGDAGPAGMNGADGSVGPQGPQGDAGPAGINGTDGSVGPQGPQGDAGPAGVNGTDGAVGPKGDQGDPGPAGAIGPRGPAGDLELPYYDEATENNGPAFHIQNDGTTGRYGIAGSAGVNGESLPDNNAGVLGHGVGAHGVYGVAANSFWAGVQGVSNSATGVGVQGYGFGGGVGGHFYTTATGVAALTTGRGNVGIGIDEPQYKMHVGGDLFVQTNLGELVMGFPDNGNQWQFSTRGQGADLQFQSKEDGLSSFTTRFRMRQNGEFQIGDLPAPTAWMHIAKNSTVSKPHLKLEEVGNDFARLELSNTTSGASFWNVAGLPSTNTIAARLNFYHHNGTAGFNRMTVTGDGRIGINGTPTGGRLHIFQGSQASNTGLRFSDGTANQDWDMRHGFGLSFFYGGTLRATISATTGAYVQGSDKRLKKNVNLVGPVMKRLKKLEVSSYQYKSDTTNTPTFGLIAQDVLPIFPELVEYMPADELYGINYSGFSVVAIKAVQEQQATIEAQEKRINDLEARLARIEALLEIGKE